MQRQTERLGPGRLSLELFHVLFRRGESQRADLAPARLEIHLVTQGPVEIDRIHHHLGE